jgi:hypothetical protein
MNSLINEMILDFAYIILIISYLQKELWEEQLSS